MLAHLKFLKFWSFLFLELKYWEYSTWYFYSLLSLKIKVNSTSSEFLGLPDFFLVLLNKSLNAGLPVKEEFQKKKYNFRTFFLFSLFFFNTELLLQKNSRLNNGALMFYSNDNLFYLDFLLRVNYRFDLNFSYNSFLNKDTVTFMGLPNFE